MNDNEVIDMVAHSSEFDNLVFRDEEQNELEIWHKIFYSHCGSLAQIMRDLCEICLRKGWCEMTLFMLEYCKVVDRQNWISPRILHKLEERGADLDRLQEMEEKESGTKIPYVHGGKLVKQHLGYDPKPGECGMQDYKEARG